MATHKPNTAVLGIWPRLLLLFGGCVAGYAFTTYQAKTQHIEPQAPVANRVQQPTRAAPPTVAPPVTEAVCAPQVPAVKAALRNTATPLGREPQTLPEWYQAFMSESRDNTWAPTTESDIREVISASNNAAIQPDYVACASSRCTVAGYVNQQATFDSCTIGRWIGDAMVFRDSFNYTCVDEEIAGVQRFVLFLDSERAL